MSMGSEMMEEMYDKWLIDFGDKIYQASKAETREGEEASYWFTIFSESFPSYISKHIIKKNESGRTNS